MILEISSGSGGGGVCMRIEFAGATAITIEAVSAPNKDQARIARMERRRGTSSHRHHQTTAMARTSTVIIRAVGGSESPPSSRGMMKQTTWTRIEGARWL